MKEYISLKKLSYNQSNYANSIDLNNYFLGNRSLTTNHVSNLLISSSFGANSILYAAWLGYIMGMWALIIHLFWCLSFYLLSFFGNRIHAFTSIHSFLGDKFGKTTQKVAAFCSVVGLLYFSGWEISISHEGIKSLVTDSSSNRYEYISIIVVIAIAISLVYPIFGGQKTNGIVDAFLNVIKIALLTFIVINLIFKIFSSHEYDVQLIFPSFSESIKNIGIIGLVTNIVFNLSWQFVDNTSWQSICSAKSNNSNCATKSIRTAGICVFIVYTLSTALGALLRVVPGLSSETILGSINNILGYGDIVTIFTIALLILSVMSLVDGIGLSVSQSIIFDCGFGDLIKRTTGKRISLTAARVLTVISGFFSAWGVHFILDLINCSIFDFVYILIVAQLSLLGVVLIGLLNKKCRCSFMWMSILIGIITGICFSLLGGLLHMNWLIDIAGTVSALISIVSAIVIAFFPKGRFYEHYPKKK